MTEMNIQGGTVHDLPDDLRQALSADAQVLAAWADITPLARNEFICWITSAKKADTRTKRVLWACDSLKQGKRRPCCWQGCKHR
jgi:uncharacterized protein YdeI (YjbR/CyaY-like superfamily)